MELCLVCKLTDNIFSALHLITVNCLLNSPRISTESAVFGWSRRVYRQSTATGEKPSAKGNPVASRYNTLIATSKRGSGHAGSSKMSLYTKCRQI